MIREELQDDFKADNEDPDDEFSKEFKSDKNKDFFDEKESQQQLSEIEERENRER